MAQKRRKSMDRTKNRFATVLVPEEKSKGLLDEWKSIALLLFLYILQGVPLGMVQSFVFFLQMKGASYSDQAIFNLVSWPFSLKILWAPLVDGKYVRSFGRRKTWLIPTQYLIGAFLFILSFKVNSWLGDKTAHHSPDTWFLTGVFFLLTLLAATQDIAVDGWALTMLSRKNIGHASSCNTIGQTAGFFIGYVAFIAADSREAASYILGTEQTSGLVTKESFIFFWAVVFFVSTTFVALLKHELPCEHHDDDVGVIESYKLANRILCLPPMLGFMFFLITCKIGFAVADSVVPLKLVEAGLKSEQLAALSVPMIPLQIILPMVISRYIVGNTPIELFSRAYPPRFAMTLMLAVYVWWAFQLKGAFPVYFYAVGVSLYVCYQVLLNCCYVSMMAFFAKISDPSVGGTYMTLLNTLFNLGGMWTQNLALWLLDRISSKTCSNPEFSCDTSSCVDNDEKCVTVSDGFYVETLVFVSVGVLWFYVFGKKFVHRIQRIPLTEWRLKK